MFVMLVITLVAVGAAVAAWLRPIPQAPASAPPKPTYSAQQVAEAKSKVCAAFEKLWHVLQVNSTRNGGDDPTAQLVVAVNERQIYVSGSAYLLTTVSDEPATPPELAAAVSQLAKLYQVITLNFLASEASRPERIAADQAASTIQRLCK
jgi:hypothetical protein